MNTPTPDVSPQRPWLGLRSYTLATQAYFYGRDEEVCELYERVQVSPLTVLYGRSGLGKTSLLQAGLLPRLTVEGRRAVLIRLDIADGAPALLEQVHMAIAAQMGVRPDGTFWEFAHHAASRDRVELARPVLVFDQFEEVFTLSRRERQNDRRSELVAFMAELAALVENRPPADIATRCTDDPDYAGLIDTRESALRVVLALREDYLHELERWKKVLPSLMRNRMELLELDGTSALQAVVGPGSKHTPALVDADVAADIVRFVAQREPGTELAEIEAVPPLLSLLCAELNESRIAEHETTLTHDRVCRHSGDILHRYYDRCFAGFPAAVREVIEDLLIDNSGRYRESSSRETVVGEMAVKGVADASTIVDELIDRRLLATDLRDNAQRIELMHDLLVPLAAASRAATEARHAAIAAKRAQVERWKRVMFVTTGVLFVVAAGAAVYANVERRNALNEQSKAEHAREQVKINLDQAARRAYGRFEGLLSDPFDRTRYAYLAESLSYQRESERKFDFTHAAALLALQQMESDFGEQRLDKEAGPAFDAQFSQDGARLITRHGIGGALVWDVASGVRLARITNDTDYFPIALSRSGTLLARSREQGVILSELASPDVPIAQLPHESAPVGFEFGAGDRRLLSLADGVVLLWNLQTLPPTPTQLPTQQNVQSVQFDASGTLIVTVETGGLARFWNGTDGTPRGKSLALGKTTQTAALSPDGTRLITVQNTQTVSVWNMSSGRRLWEHASKVAVESAGFSHDGSRVAINYADGRLDVRAAQDGTSIASADPSPQLLITSASESVGALPIHPAFSPDDLFVAGHADGAPALFAMASGEKVRPLGDRGDALRFHFAPDGLHVLTLGVKTRLHDIRSRAPLCESLRHDAPVTDAFESPGRDVIASTVGGIYRWNVAGHTIVRQFRATAAEQAIDLPARYKPPLLAEQPSRLGEFVALRNRLNLAGTPWNLVAGNGVAWTRVAAARSATEVVVYDTASGEAVSDPIRTSATILTLQLDSSGTRVLTLGIDFESNQYVIESWEVRESTFPAQLSQQRFPRAPRVSPDASVFAADGGQRNLAIWNAGTPTSAQAKSTPGPVSNIAFDAEITAIAFDDDATAIAVGLDDGTVAVNKIGGPLVFREKLPGVAGRIRFDARRPRLAVAVDDHVFILDRRTGARLADLTLDFEATAIDFADDENTIVLAGARGLQLWSLDANAPLTPILLRDRRVNAVHFSADSQRLIASLDDGAVNVCHANGRIKASPQELAKALDQISGLAVQDDGRVRKTVTANPLASFAGKPGPPSYFERVLLWHYADRGTRTIAPLSTTRLSDHIASEVAWARGAALGDRNVQQAARAALMNAYFLDPHDSNVVAALKALDASGNAKRAASDAIDARSATPTVSASAPAALPPAEAR